MEWHFQKIPVGFALNFWLSYKITNQLYQKEIHNIAKC